MLNLKTSLKDKYTAEVTAHILTYILQANVPD